MSDGNHNQPDKAFEARVRRALETAADDIAPDVAERLAAMRRSAVAELDDPPRRFRLAWGPASAVVASVAMVGLAVGMFVMNDIASVPEMPAISDEAELLVSQDIDLLTELEFLAWLEEEANDAG